MCQEGAGDVLLHGEDVGQHAGRLWDESGEGRSGAPQQAQRGASDCMLLTTQTNIILPIAALHMTTAALRV